MGCGLATVLLLGGSASAADVPQPMTGCFDVWPPYTQADGSGITPQLVAAVAAQVGLPIPLTRMPWKRCLAAVEQGTVSFALDASPRAGYLRSALPVTHVRSGVFARLGTFSEIDDLSRLKEVRVGRPLGWSNWELVAAHMPEGPVYTTVSAAGAEQMMEMLRHDRIDIYVDDVLSARRLAAERGFPLTTLLIPPEGTDLYVLFGPGGEQDRVRWDAAMEALHRNGWLERHFRQNGMM